MEKFAKLIESKKCGQILVKLDEGESGEVEIRFYFKPEGLGVCNIALNYEDDWDIAEKVFNEVLTDKFIENMVSNSGFYKYKEGK